MEIDIKDWGKTPTGEDVKLFTITNSQDNSVALTNYGATWVSAIVPDSNGNKADIVLGFPNLEAYLSDTCYIGTTVGRYANRIENAQFSIEGQVYKLSANVAPHILHGGEVGINQSVWDYEIHDKGITFKTASPDGDQGFPGNIQIEVNYVWTDKNELDINFRVKTDKPTHINLTNHVYFNLKGDDSVIHNQVLKVYSDYYLSMKEGSIVSGEFRPVKDTPFDFTTAKPIGRDINADDDQLKLAGGYDHTFVLKRKNDKVLALAAEAYDPSSGRALEVYTTYPSIHLYAGNFLESTWNGKNGKLYGKREAFCLEAQYMPNTPNQLAFPSSVLYPGQEYNQLIRFKFK
ncbi:MAG: galactose mutarotase [Prevotellaceae bacterium]|jgi:aldose 1-epimerase|nr:galactose mutarotase [Prevotellaceae bacterium]